MAGREGAAGSVREGGASESTVPLKGAMELFSQRLEDFVRSQVEVSNCDLDALKDLNHSMVPYVEFLTERVKSTLEGTKETRARVSKAHADSELSHALRKRALELEELVGDLDAYVTDVLARVAFVAAEEAGKDASGSTAR